MLLPKDGDGLKKFPEQIKTGWVFAGYYNFSQETWQQGPYVKVVDRVNKYDKSVYPVIGDTIKVIKPRNIVIYNYKYSGEKYEMESPAKMVAIIRPEIDHTRFVLAKGIRVEVRDIDIRHSLGRVDCIWCRVGP